MSRTAVRRSPKKRQLTGWQPTIRGGGAPLYELLINSIREDIAKGVLPPGVKLPPLRDLADAMSLGIGTVAKAYTEAERLGLVRAHVGRGTFVVDMNENPFPSKRIDPRSPIDLSRNVVPLLAAAARLREALRMLAVRDDLAESLDYAPPMGTTEHRRAAADWLKRSARFDTVDWRRLLVVNGAHHALVLSLSLVAAPGDEVFCEAGTFHGMKTLAEQAGVRLIGLDMDNEGLLPDALDRAVSQRSARVVYLIPTLQNPTARTMSFERRRAIASIVRRHSLWILEDDVYAALANGDPHPLANLVPDRTYYISGLSKTICPGLRAGYLVTPNVQAFDSAVRRIVATTFSPVGLAGLVANEWLSSREADLIVGIVRDQIHGRTTLAHSVLGRALDPGTPEQSLHVWLPMNEGDAQKVALLALQRGVDVTPPPAPIVEPALLSGLRVCLGGTSDLKTLETALNIVGSALSSELEARAIL